MWRWLLPAALLASTTGCPGFGDLTEAEAEGIDEVPTWSGEIQAVLQEHCWRCHGETPRFGAPFSMFTYDQAVSRADRILVRAVQQQTMPPTGPIPGEARGLLEAWINGGTPLGDPSALPDMGTPEPDTGTDEPEPDMGPAPDIGVPEEGPTWATMVATDCSARTDAAATSGPKPQEDLDLTTYEGFLAGGVSGVIHGNGDPDMALLIRRLRGDGVLQMPLGGQPLPEAQIELVAEWIAAGFPED